MAKKERKPPRPWHRRRASCFVLFNGPKMAGVVSFCRVLLVLDGLVRVAFQTSLF